MNKIFKVIWNTASQSWTVVSELTKAHKKQSAVKNGVKLSVLVTALFSGFTYAATTAQDSTNSTITYININSNGGTSAQASGTDSIAIGNGANTSAQDSIVIGHNANISVPTENNTTSGGAIVIGANSSSASKNTVVIGNGAKVEQTGLTLASGENAVAIGTSSSSAYNGVAIGNEAQSTFSNAVAIGNGAIAGNGIDSGDMHSFTAVGAGAKQQVQPVLHLVHYQVH